jgi:hypothetical protein
LASLGLISTYKDFSELERIMQQIESSLEIRAKKELQKQYISNTSWPAFTAFLVEKLNVMLSNEPLHPIPSRTGILPKKAGVSGIRR